MGNESGVAQRHRGYKMRAHGRAQFSRAPITITDERNRQWLPHSVQRTITLRNLGATPLTRAHKPRAYPTWKPHATHIAICKGFWRRCRMDSTRSDKRDNSNACKPPWKHARAVVTG